MLIEGRRRIVQFMNKFLYIIQSIQFPLQGGRIEINLRDSQFQTINGFQVIIFIDFIQKTFQFKDNFRKQIFINGFNFLIGDIHDSVGKYLFPRSYYC